MPAASEPVPVPRRPGSHAVPRDPKRLSRLACTIAFAYPLALVSAIYGSWLLAWLVLGRRPVASMDDPTQISPFVTVAYYASGLVLVGSPVAAILGIVATVGFARTLRLPARAAVILPLLLAALWAGTIALLRSNVLDVNRWWFD